MLGARAGCLPLSSILLKIFLTMQKHFISYKYNGAVESSYRIYLKIDQKVFAMVCSDTHEGPVVPIRSPGVSLMPIEERLSALSPSERKHFLESIAYHRDMLEELAKM